MVTRRRSLAMVMASLLAACAMAGCSASDSSTPAETSRSQLSDGFVNNPDAYHSPVFANPSRNSTADFESGSFVTGGR